MPLPFAYSTVYDCTDSVGFVVVTAVFVIETANKTICDGYKSTKVCEGVSSTRNLCTEERVFLWNCVI